LESHGHSNPASRTTAPTAIRIRCIGNIVLQAKGATVV
jgi:hypothetical protein